MGSYGIRIEEWLTGLTVEINKSMINCSKLHRWYSLLGVGKMWIFILAGKMVSWLWIT